MGQEVETGWVGWMLEYLVREKVDGMRQYSLIYEAFAWVVDVAYSKERVCRIIVVGAGQRRCAQLHTVALPPVTVTAARAVPAAADAPCTPTPTTAAALARCGTRVRAGPFRRRTETSPPRPAAARRRRRLHRGAGTACAQ